MKESNIHGLNEKQFVWDCEKGCVLRRMLITLIWLPVIAFRLLSVFGLTENIFLQRFNDFRKVCCADCGLRYFS